MGRSRTAPQRGDFRLDSRLQIESPAIQTFDEALAAEGVELTARAEHLIAEGNALVSEVASIH